eukprot:GHRR01007062.1.p1 GENE.GHRR01007062.1~~GHRR01007062.1.p1  ORF type:complete len:368 (+),score=129.92 GHRR01007062.1:238-1341(+)
MTDFVSATIVGMGIEPEKPMELTPQAAALARMAAEAKCRRDEDWDIRPHPAIEAAAPTRDQFDEPGTAPVCIMRNPIAGDQEIAGTADLAKPVPINTDKPIPISTSMFEGKLMLHIRGLQSTHRQVFNGKKRYVHLAMQGRLKRDVKASDYWNGHEWFSISNLMPTSFVNIAYTAAAKMFSSTTRVCPSASNGQIAGFLNPVLASCQLVNVSVPGQEPDMWAAQEDMRLLSPQLADKNGEPLASEKRRRWFDSPSNAESVVLSREYVYTWHVWQHWCNIATYRLQLGSLLSLDLCQFSEGQPMQIMAKDQSTGEYSINLLLWHKNLLYQDQSSTSTSNNLSSLNVKDTLKSFKSGWKSLMSSSSTKV